MKRFAYEMLVANAVMLAALFASCLIWTLWTSLVSQENKMIKKLFYSHLGSETLIIAACIALIIAGSIFGAWALLQTL